MKLRLLIGTAGSGKTHACLHEITERLANPQNLEGDASLCFLVPEQATFQLERALLEHTPDVTAVSSARVLSFKRLSHLAMEQTGPLTRAHLGELGKLLAFQVAVERERSSLGAFGRAAQTEGFLEAIAATYSELRAYNLQVDAFDHVAKVLRGEHHPIDAHSDTQERVGGQVDLLGRKLLDVARIARTYEHFIAGRFQDSESSLDLAAAALRETELLRGASIWIDGFAGFTPQEYELLKTLMRQCREMTIALCLDPTYVSKTPVEQWEEGPPDALFHPTRQTLVRIRDCAAAVGVNDIACEFLPRSALTRGEEGSIAPRFLSSPMLYELERSLIAEESTANAASDVAAEDAFESMTSDTPDFALVVEAPNRYGEVEAAAREVQRLVREDAMRYSEIAVVVRDLERFRSEIETIFAEWQIPFFLDHKPSAYHHPAIRLLCGLLDLCRSGFRTDVLFRCLKTDLVPITRDEVDALENEAIERGIDGSLWLRREIWAGTAYEEIWQRGLAGIVTFVRRVESLRESGDGSAKPAAFLTSISSLLNEFRVAERLSEWSGEALESGDHLLAQEHVQVWNGLLDLLVQVHEVLGDGRLTFEEFQAALNAGLQRMRLGRVPPKLDQVLVGSVERSRQPDLKCTILLGMNDGHFPAIPAEDPIFSDDDRARLHDVGVELGPGSRQRLFHEKYLLYIALTRASERLVVTYSRSDEGGRTMRPSSVVRWLLERFPRIPSVLVATRPSDHEWPERPATVLGWLTRVCRDAVDGRSNVGPPVERILGAYAWVTRAGVAPPLWADPLQALVYCNTSAPISPEMITSLYGDSWATSASRLEDLASCAFKHFVGYGLKLRERMPPEMDPATMGSLAHGVLSAFVRGLKRDEIDWAELSRVESDQRVDDAISYALDRMRDGGFAQSAADRYVVRRMTSTLRAVVWALGEHCRSGRFRPLAVELGFGEGDELPPVVVDTPEGRSVRLHGRIDRLDVAEHGERRWMRVIDYKSSRRPFQLGRLFHGLDLQLVIYLLAAAGGMQEEALLPAGCLYLPVYDPIVSSDVPTPSDDERWRKELKGAGIIVDEDDVPRLMDSVSVGHSDLVPLYFKKDGSLGARSQTVSRERLQLLLEYTELIVGKLVDTWAEGSTRIEPYRLSNETPCSYCAYKPVCQFDASLPSNRYRHIQPPGDDRVWSEIEVAWDGGDARVG